MLVKGHLAFVKRKPPTCGIKREREKTNKLGRKRELKGLEPSLGAEKNFKTTIINVLREIRGGNASLK